MSTLRGSWRGLFGALLVLALLAGVACLGGLPEGAATAVHRASAGLLFFGAAAPLLRRLAPREPAILKLVLFSSLLSPLLLLAVWLGWRAVIGGDAMGLPLALTYFTAAGFQVLGLVRKDAADAAGPIGRAPLTALAIAVLFAGAVAAIVFGQEAIRVSFHGLLHTSILEATTAGVPPENPWLAGGSLQYYWVWHALGSLVSGSLWIAPTFALAALNVWAAFCMPLALYFLGAPLWRRGAWDLGGVALGLFGLNLMGGWLWLVAGAPFDGAVHPLAMLQSNFGALVGEGDLRLAWGPSKFGNMSSYPAALALLVGGWLAAAHALAPLARRDGEGEPDAALKSHIEASLRIWGLLAALALGASFAINPLVGAAGLGGTAVAFLILADFSRLKLQVLALVAIAALPGLVEVLLAGRGRDAAAFTFGFGDLGRTLGPLLPLLPLALLPILRRPFTTDRGPRRAVLILLASSAAVSLLLALFVQLPLGNEYKFVRTAQIPLALLAAGGLGQLLAWTGPAAKLARGLGILVIAAFGISAASSSFLGLRAFAAISQASLPLDETRAGVLPTGTSDGARAMAWLRAAAPALATPEGRGVLVLNPPLEGAPAMDFGGTAFGTPSNLQGHAAAAFSGLSLFVDRRSYLVDADPRWAPRLGLVQAFYRGEPLAVPALAAELEQLGRQVLLLVQHGQLPREDEHSFINDAALLADLDLEILAQFGELSVLGNGQARDLLGPSTSTLQD